MPHPTSKPGQPGGNHGPTRPTNLPLAFSSTTNMPAPCSAQCPAMTAAFRQPTSSLVTGLPSTVMNRAVPGSDSIAVFGAISALHHCRSFRRSVSTTGPLGRASVTPCLRGAIIATSSLQWMDTGRFISGSKGGAYHPRKIRLAIGLGKQQHAGIEMAVMDNGFVRIAGGEQYLQRRPSLQRLVGELAAIHRARHDHIGKQQIDCRGTIDNDQGFRRIDRRQRGIAQALNLTDDECSHQMIVLNDQYGLTAAFYA